MLTHAMHILCPLTAPKRIWTANRLRLNALSSLPFEVEELQTLIPHDVYVDVSLVPQLYQKSFKKRLAEQPGANKVLKLFTQLLDTFSMKPN